MPLRCGLCWCQGQRASARARKRKTFRDIKSRAASSWIAGAFLTSAHRRRQPHVGPNTWQIGASLSGLVVIPIRAEQRGRIVDHYLLWIVHSKDNQTCVSAMRAG